MVKVLIDGQTVDAERIALVCEAHHVTELWLYGSMVAGDYTPDSDVDFMAVIDPDRLEDVSVPALTVDLTGILGGSRHADVVCEHRMNPYYVKATRRTGIQIYGRNEGGNQPTGQPAGETESRPTTSVR